MVDVNHLHKEMIIVYKIIMFSYNNGIAVDNHWIAIIEVINMHKQLKCKIVPMITLSRVLFLV